MSYYTGVIGFDNRDDPVLCSLFDGTTHFHISLSDDVDSIVQSHNLAEHMSELKHISRDHRIFTHNNKSREALKALANFSNLTLINLSTFLPKILTYLEEDHGFRLIEKRSSSAGQANLLQNRIDRDLTDGKVMRSTEPEDLYNTLKTLGFHSPSGPSWMTREATSISEALSVFYDLTDSQKNLKTLQNIIFKRGLDEHKKYNQMAFDFCEYFSAVLACPD